MRDEVQDKWMPKWVKGVYTVESKRLEIILDAESTGAHFEFGAIPNSRKERSSPVGAEVFSWIIETQFVIG